MIELTKENVPYQPIMDEQTRNELVKRVDVLESLRPIPTLPGRDYITTEQVALYFKTKFDEVKKVCTKYKKEFEADGMETKTIDEITDGQDVEIEKQKGRVLVAYANGRNVSIGYKGARVFPKKAVMRFGLLLENSILAKDLRRFMFVNDYLEMEDRKEKEREEAAVQLVDTTEILGRRIDFYRSIEEPLFLARDVADWIDYARNGRGYRDISNMVKSVDKEEKFKTKILSTKNVNEQNLGQIDSDGKTKTPFLFLTEDGLYELCMLSRKPIARRMKKQIKEYLRNIRKTGGAVDFGKESQFIEHYFPSFSDDVKLAMVSDLRNQNKELKEKNDKLKNDNKLLAAEILTWSDRNKLNAGIRKLASVSGSTFPSMWNELYKNLQYKYGINVKNRGDKPYIQWIQEHEWDKVLKIFSAICEARNLSPTDMLQQTAPVENLTNNEEDDELWD